MTIMIREFGDRCWFTLVYYIVTTKWIVFNLWLQAKLASFERILPEVGALDLWQGARYA